MSWVRIITKYQVQYVVGGHREYFTLLYVVGEHREYLSLLYVVGAHRDYDNH